MNTPTFKSVARLTVTIFLALWFANIAGAEAPSLQDWFARSLEGKAVALEGKEIAPADIVKTRAAVFEAYKAALTASGAEKKFNLPNVIANKPAGAVQIAAGNFVIGPGEEMPYVVLQKGERPLGGWPLMIAMHGGGGTGEKLPNPHGWGVNTQEWNTQVRLAIGLYPDNAIYFVPRMVNDNQGRWWKEYNYKAYVAMIRHAIVYWDVNPNRVYMLGISEGGYGTETLAARYPDRFAAADGMACGEGTSIHVENLRNLPFRTDVGEKDTAYGRYPNAVKKHDLLKAYQKEDGEGYVNDLEVQAGRGHGIDYRPGPKWLLQYTRNAHPKRVVYTLFQHDGVKSKGAYWLWAVNDLEKKVIYLDGKINTAENSISITAKATKEDEKVQAADAQAALADAGEIVPATGLKLRIWLHESVLDLSKPVKVSVNGKLVETITPKLTTGTLCESLMEFGDWEFSYAAKVEVVVP